MRYLHSVILIGLTFAVALGFSQIVPKALPIQAQTGPLKGQTLYSDTFAVFVGIAHFENPKIDGGATPGKNQTKIPEIECAVNDARTMRNLLVEKFGFNPSPDHIVFLANEMATKANIERALAELGDHNRIKETDRVLVYFSTHGQRIPRPDHSAEGFLIPYDAAINFGDIKNPPQYRTSCLDMEYIGKMMEDCPARHRALIVDACYSGFSLNAKKLENLDGNLSPAQILNSLSARGLSILAASTTDQVATGSTNPNGLSDYTRGLRDALLNVESEGTTTVLQSVAATARAAVLEKTKSMQDPGFALRDGEGQFILCPIKPKPIPAANLSVLKFTSIPTGAMVLLDGKPYLPTPCDYPLDLNGTPEAKLSVDLTLDGYKPWGVKSVSLKRGEAKSIGGTLFPIPGSNARKTYDSLNPVAAESGVVMKFVSGGTFSMGDEGWDNTGPVHSVSLSDFWLSQTPITVAQFRVYTQAENGYKSDFKDDFPWDGYRKPDWGWVDDHPMVGVTWAEARAYCHWAGGDLPTEAQFEYAASGHGKQKYSWGNQWDAENVWHSLQREGDVAQTVPVNRRSHIYQTGEGLSDLCRNVCQWCRDFYQESYSLKPNLNPEGPEGGPKHSARGGSWKGFDPEMFLATRRLGCELEYFSSDFGFRMASH